MRTHHLQRLTNAAHWTRRKRVIADHRCFDARSGHEAGQQASPGSRITHVQRLGGLLELAGHAGNVECIVAKLCLGSHLLHRRKRASGIFAVEVARHLGRAIRQRGQHRHALGNALITRHSNRTTQRCRKYCLIAHLFITTRFTEERERHEDRPP